MYNSGDAAEQVVRMSLEGAEFALKITGTAAKNLAAALYTVLKDQKKTKGKARIEAMLREKRPLKVYTIKKEDCPEFAKQAKGYGILYAPIPVKKGDDTTQEEPRPTTSGTGSSLARRSSPASLLRSPPTWTQTRTRPT